MYLLTILTAGIESNIDYTLTVVGEEKQRENAHVPGEHKWALHVSGDEVSFFLLIYFYSL